MVVVDRQVELLRPVGEEGIAEDAEGRGVDKAARARKGCRLDDVVGQRHVGLEHFGRGAPRRARDGGDVEDGVGVTHELQRHAEIGQVGGDVAPAALARRRHGVDAQHVVAGGDRGRRDMPAERRLARRRPSVDPHHPPRQGAVAASGVQSRADRQPPLRGIECRGNRPRRRLALAARPPADFIEPRAAQPPSGRQEGQRLQEVGLAGAVGAHQHDGTAAAVEAELAIIAEVREPELAHGQDGRRSAGCGVGGVGECADRRRRHTRIGMST